MKKLLIMVMAIFMVFTFSSCEDPKPVEYTVSFVGVDRPSEKVIEGTVYKVPDIPKEGYEFVSVKNGDTVVKVGDVLTITGDVVLTYDYVKVVLIETLTVPASMKIPMDYNGAIKVSYAPETASKTELKWTSDNETVVKFNEAGKLIPVAVGKANVTVKAVSGTASATTAIEVVPAITEIGFNEPSIKRKIVDEIDLFNYLTVNAGSIKDGITFKSSDENIAVVDSSTGILTGKYVGTVTITATTPSGLSATMDVKIDPYVGFSPDMPSKLYFGQELKVNDYIVTKPECASYKVTNVRSDNEDRISVEDLDPSYYLVAERDSGKTDVSVHVDLTFGDDVYVYTLKKEIASRTAFNAEDLYYLDRGESIQLKQVSPESMEYTMSTDYSDAVEFPAVNTISYKNSGFARIFIADKNSGNTSDIVDVRNTEYVVVPTGDEHVSMELNSKMYICDSSMQPITGATSSNGDVVSIDQNGRLTAVSTGTANVTVGGKVIPVDVYSWKPELPDVFKDINHKLNLYATAEVSIFGKLPEGAYFDTYAYGKKTGISAITYIFNKNLNQSCETRTLDMTKLDAGTELPSEAFKSSVLTSVKLPENLTTIKKNAFYYSGITDLYVPVSVQTLEEGCLYSSIVKLSIPKHLKTGLDAAYEIGTRPSGLVLDVYDE